MILVIGDGGLMAIGAKRVPEIRNRYHKDIRRVYCPDLGRI